MAHCPTHRADGFACGTHRRPPKPKASLPPPKRRTTPLGGTLGAQWTDSVTHVPIVVPALLDQPGSHVAGSYGDLVAHATCSDEVELLPPYVCSLPCLNLLAQEVVRKSPFATHPLRNMPHTREAGTLTAMPATSATIAAKVRPLPKGHQLNSARRDAQAIASILGETLNTSRAHVTSHHSIKVPTVGSSIQFTSVKPGAAQGECKSPVASPGQKNLKVSTPLVARVTMVCLCLA